MKKLINPLKELKDLIKNNTKLRKTKSFGYFNGTCANDNFLKNKKINTMGLKEK